MIINELCGFSLLILSIGNTYDDDDDDEDDQNSYFKVYFLSLFLTIYMYLWYSAITKFVPYYIIYDISYLNNILVMNDFSCFLVISSVYCLQIEMMMNESFLNQNSRFQ